jgi:hypothetical protein
LLRLLDVVGATTVLALCLFPTCFGTFSNGLSLSTSLFNNGVFVAEMELFDLTIGFVTLLFRETGSPVMLFVDGTLSNVESVLSLGAWPIFGVLVFAPALRERLFVRESPIAFAVIGITRAFSALLLFPGEVCFGCNLFSGVLAERSSETEMACCFSPLTSYESLDPFLFVWVLLDSSLPKSDQIGGEVACASGGVGIDPLDVFKERAESEDERCDSKDWFRTSFIDIRAAEAFFLIAFPRATPNLNLVPARTARSTLLKRRSRLYRRIISRTFCLWLSWS